MTVTIGPGAPFIIQTKPLVHSKPVAFRYDFPVFSHRGFDALAGSYGPPRRFETVAAANKDTPESLTSALAKQVVRDQPKQALENLSLNLAAFLKDGESSVDQTLTQYHYSTMEEGAAPLDVASFESGRKQDNDALKLSIKTKDGDKLTFSFRLEAGYGHTEAQKGIGYQSLAVSFELDGELSEREMAELTGLSESLNALANSYFNGNGAQIADLKLDELDQVASLSLSLEGVGPSGIELSMTDNDVSREYNIEMNGDTVKMSRDKLSLLGSSDPERREAVLNHYRKMLIDGVQRSHGTGDQQALMLEAFNLLHGADSETGTSAVKLTAEESAMLTGLPDFAFEFEGRVVRSVANPQFGTLVEQMSLSLSQQTQIRTYGPQAREIEQVQDWTLKSTYFEPLPYMDKVDLEKQNYNYVSLQEHGQVRNQVGLEDGQIEAVQTQHFDSKRDEMTFIDGELADWKTTSKSLDEIRDLTARLRTENSAFDAVLLEEILLDPMAMAQRAEVERVEHDLS